jgi:hypothetical protein
MNPYLKRQFGCTEIAAERFFSYPAPLNIGLFTAHKKHWGFAAPDTPMNHDAFAE